MDLKLLRQLLSLPPRELGVVELFWAVRPSFKLHWQLAVGSTNQELWNLIDTGASSGTVLMAATQSAGRGQWGRQWQSGPGGLYLSLSLKPELPVHDSPYLTIASAWGLVTSLRSLGISAQAKWPNDVIVRGKKVAGLLIETRVEGTIIRDVVIGLGLNGFNAVPASGISLEQIFQPDLPPPPLNSLEGLAAVALYGLLQGYLYWQNYGNQVLLNEYQTYMAHLGQIITIQDQQVQVVGIAASGNLQVQSPANEQQFAHKLEIEPGKVALGYNA